MDISLYKNESQIEKKASAKRKSSDSKLKSAKTPKTLNVTTKGGKRKKSEVDTDDDHDDAYEPPKKAARDNARNKTASKKTSNQVNIVTFTCIDEINASHRSSLYRNLRILLRLRLLHRAQRQMQAQRKRILMRRRPLQKTQKSVN